MQGEKNDVASELLLLVFLASGKTKAPACEPVSGSAC